MIRPGALTAQLSHYEARTKVGSSGFGPNFSSPPAKLIVSSLDVISPARPVDLKPDAADALRDDDFVPMHEPLRGRVACGDVA